MAVCLSDGCTNCDYFSPDFLMRNVHSHIPNGELHFLHIEFVEIQFYSQSAMSARIRRECLWREAQDLKSNQFKEFVDVHLSIMYTPRKIIRKS